jgi:hypothetical protein
MIENPIYPFNICKNVIIRNNENRRLRMRKGDLVEVPPYDGDSLSSYFDPRSTVRSSIQIKNFSDINSNGSFENKSPQGKSIFFIIQVRGKYSI